MNLATWETFGSGCVEVREKPDEKIITSMEVFPNPTSDYVIISSSTTKSKITSKTIRDMNGRSIQKINSDSNRVSLNEMPSGVYFIEVLFDDNNYLTQKVIVIR
jgi:hypothetical protein